VLIEMNSGRRGPGEEEYQTRDERRWGILRRFIYFGLMVVSFFAVVRSAAAADGELDPTFGTGGRVVTDFNNSNDVLIDLVLQTDGKILAVGFTYPTGSSPHISLVRYNTDGTLDAGFGSGGKVVTQISPNDGADAVAVQSDGKIVVGGNASTPNVVDTSFALVRYNANGSVDATFGNGGVVTTNIGDYLDGISAIGIRPDGKIVAVGFRAIVRPPGEQRNSDIALARYNPDGSLDTTFGTGGKTVSDFGPVADYFADDATSINFQPDGKIVVCGDSDGGGYFDFLAARYTADGFVDTTFGSNGFIKTDLGDGYEDGSNDAAIQPDGKIISVGSALPNSYDLDFAMIRYTAGGTLDTTFGNGGKVVFGLESLHDEEFTSVAVQGDGKILALGDANSSVNSGFLIFRFNSNGSPDTSFGSGGRVRTTFSSAVQSEVIVLQPDARIIAAGYSPLYQSSDFVLARYLNSAPVKVNRPKISGAP
jgi:uncharacterized delta-60 repeat protein